MKSTQSLDVKTRTMPVELDVANAGARLSPGMYAEVIWPVRRKQTLLFVPPSATTTERTFVVRYLEPETQLKIHSAIVRGAATSAYSSSKHNATSAQRG